MVIELSHVNLFIPGKTEVYLAPAGIEHHIKVHHYQPPADFVSALLACPDPHSSDYRNAINRVNHGVEAPLYRENQIF